MAVILLPPMGNERKSNLYPPIKTFLTASVSSPSQVIQTATIKRAKGLRSVINKVIVQICAKMGDIPWACQELPLADMPTMVVGMDVFHKVGKLSVLGMCASAGQEMATCMAY